MLSGLERTLSAHTLSCFQLIHSRFIFIVSSFRTYTACLVFQQISATKSNSILSAQQNRPTFCFPCLAGITLLPCPRKLHSSPTLISYNHRNDRRPRQRSSTAQLRTASKPQWALGIFEIIDTMVDGGCNLLFGDSTDLFVRHDPTISDFLASTRLFFLAWVSCGTATEGRGAGALGKS